jgi:hypothetical protein
MFAAFSVAAVSDKGSLYRSDDLGQSWTRFDHGVSMDSTLMTIATTPRTAHRAPRVLRRTAGSGVRHGGWWHHLVSEQAFAGS